MSNSEPAWIWLDHAFELRECYARFRRTFVMEQVPTAVLLRITADSRYRLYVNGQFVDYGPARGYPQRMFFDELDVGPFLHTGRNVLAVMVYQPGYSHFSYIHRATAGLWLSLDLGGELLITSNEDWKADRDVSYSRNVRRISIYGSSQEVRDLRKTEDWTTVEFDDTAWPSARIQGLVGQLPWLELESRPLARLSRQCHEMKFWEAFTVPEKTQREGDDPHTKVVEQYTHRRPLEEFDSSGPTPFILGQRGLMLCYGLPASALGSAIVQIDGARGGERVMLTYFEKGRPGKWVLSDPENYCQMRMTDSYQLAAGSNRLQPFTPRGGRYLLITIAGGLTDGLELNVQFEQSQCELEFRTRANLHDERLTEIMEMCQRTLQSCVSDAVVDCPWREQAAWLGDGVITGRIIAECCGDVRPLRQTLDLAAAGVYPDGLVPSVLAAEAHAYLILDYNFSWLEGVAIYLEHSPDRSSLKRYWPIIEGVLTRFSQDRDDQGLIRSQRGRRLFLDWAELPREEPSALYNLRYLYALMIADRLSSMVRDTATSEQVKSWIGETSASLRSLFCRDGVWYDSVSGTSRSQHVAAFLVLTGLVTNEAAEAILDEAVARSLDKQSTRDLVLASPYMHYYLFEALVERYRERDIQEIVRYRWGKWLDADSPTTWENWKVDFPDGSVCHSWSTHPLLFL